MAYDHPRTYFQRRLITQCQSILQYTPISASSTSAYLEEVGCRTVGGEARQQQSLLALHGALRLGLEGQVDHHLGTRGTWGVEEAGAPMEKDGIGIGISNNGRRRRDETWNAADTPESAQAEASEISQA